MFVPDVDYFLFFFFNDTATTEIYTYGHTLSLHDALPIYTRQGRPPEKDQHQVHRPGPYQPTYHSADRQDAGHSADQSGCDHHDEGHHGGEDAPERKDGKTARQVHRSWWPRRRSEEHTSELQSLMRISSAVLCLKKKKTLQK